MILLISVVGLIYSLRRTGKRLATLTCVFLGLAGGLLVTVLFGCLAGLSEYSSGELGAYVALLVGTLVALIHSRRNAKTLKQQEV